MARRPTHRVRPPDRPDEPAVGIHEDTASQPVAAIQGSGGELQPAPAGPKARRTGRPAWGILPGSVASPHVAAAAAAAGAAVGGIPTGTEAVAAPTEPQPGAEPVPGVAAEASNAVSPAVANAEAEPVNAAVAPASAAEAGPSPDFEAAPVSAVAVAAGVAAGASAVSTAIAATVAARASYRADAGAGAGPATEAAVSAMAPVPPAASPTVPAGPARPPVTVQDYRRPPAKYSPSIIRAAHDPEAEETAVPAPLFSNEGIIRQAEAQRRSRFLGPVGGLVVALLGAGKAFGHTGESSRADADTLLAGPGDVVLVAESPDFDSIGNPRRRSHRRRSGVILAATLVVALAGLALGGAFLPMEKVPAATASPGSPPKVAALDPSSEPASGSPTEPSADDPTAPPSGILIGDDPLPPGATRRPVATSTATQTAAASAPATTAGPSPTALPTATPSAAQPSNTPTPTPTPTPVPTPTPTPTPTPVPTPTPTPVMFALVYSPITPPLVSPGNGTFYVASLPGASCRLWRLPVTGDNNTKRSAAFTTDTSGWAYVLWGSSWPISNVTVTVYATCTAAQPDKRTAQSANVNALWPPNASPSPSPT